MRGLVPDRHRFSVRIDKFDITVRDIVAIFKGLNESAQTVVDEKIVGVEKAHIGAIGQLRSHVPRPRRPLSSLTQQADSIWDRLGVTSDDIKTLVGRPVINYNYFNGLIELVQTRINCLPYPLGGIITRNYNRHQRPRLPHQSDQVVSYIKECAYVQFRTRFKRGEMGLATVPVASDGSQRSSWNSAREIRRSSTSMARCLRAEGARCCILLGEGGRREAFARRHGAIRR